MSNTRYADPGSPLRQERFASSAEFDRGLLGNLVAKRCELLERPEDRNLIWWLQLLSWKPGGLRKIAADLIARFPDRIRREEAEYTDSEAGQIAGMLTRLCLDPQCHLAAEGHLSFLNYAESLCFDKLTESLREFQTEWTNAQRAPVVTELGVQVYETLDYALDSRCMVLIDGLARTGKSFAARKWCEFHAGQARYVQVPSSNDEVTFLRRIAEALGLASALALKAVRIRERIECTLQSSRLMLVLDEASHLWPQASRRYAVPGRINWILTALVNFEVPVALITTPQFIRNQKAVERFTGWTSEQFTGRLGHYQKLPDALPEQDLAAVAQALLPGGDSKSIETLVAYAQASTKYLAGIESVARRALHHAAKAGRRKVLFADVREAITGSAIPSDSAHAAAVAMAEQKIAGRARAVPAPVPSVRRQVKPARLPEITRLAIPAAGAA
jgi:AAA domain